MLVDIINSKGEKVSKTDLPETIFNAEVKPAVLHEVVKMQLAKKRSGTACVKHRSDVKGSTRKLFRQKGTGRARRGNIKSPLLRGGGSVFGPNPRSYAYTVPKKVRKLALRMALSSKLKDNELTVLDRFDMEEIKTKAFLSVIRTLGKENALLVTDGKNEKLELSSRNLPGIKVLRAEGLNVYDILKYKDLILLESSLKMIEGRFNT